MMKHYIVGLAALLMLGFFSSARVSADALSGNTGGNVYVNTSTLNIGIGTTSPFALLSVFSGADYLPHAASVLLAIASSSAGTATSTLFSINSDGHHIYGGTTPTVISGASAVFGSDELGSTTPNVGTTRLIYIKYAQAYSRPPHCFVNLNVATTSVALGTSTVIYAVSTTTTQMAITASAATLGGSTIDWSCPSN